jgi:hypothetical protein
VTGMAGSAHGDIGELSAACVVEDMSDVHRGALGAVTRDGISVTEAIGPDVVRPKVAARAAASQDWPPFVLRRPGLCRSGVRGISPSVFPPWESGAQQALSCTLQPSLAV